jgi:hypothetical protein
MKAARIPDWAWVLLIADGFLALVLWLKKQAGSLLRRSARSRYRDDFSTSLEVST